jgi:hypothetical protein
MKTLYVNEVEMYLVQLDKISKETYLKVVVGGMAMYEVSKIMDIEMLEIFKEDPKKLLKFVEKIRLEN